MKVLLVSSYPPMRCGIARYSANLVKALKEAGVEVWVACHKDGGGDFRIIRWGDSNMWSRLLRIVREIEPDVVHVQYNLGLYERKILGSGIATLSKRLREMLGISMLKKFYEKCDVSIVTTPHDVFVLHECLRFSIANALNEREVLKLLKGPLGTFLHVRRIPELAKSGTEVVNLSETQRRVVGRGTVIYHGAECHLVTLNMSKEELRQELGLPLNYRLALVAGFINREQKDYGLLNRIKLPKGWKLVIHAPHSFYDPGASPPSIKQSVILTRYLSDKEYSMLLSACDVLMLPYKIVHCSGVMFDGIANGLPFIATGLTFFREFAAKGLGFTFQKENDIPKLMVTVNEKCNEFKKAIRSFATEITWKNVALQHINVYERAMDALAIG